MLPQARARTQHPRQYVISQPQLLAQTIKQANSDPVEGHLQIPEHPLAYCAADLRISFHLNTVCAKQVDLIVD